MQDLAGDVAGTFGGEEEDGLRDVLDRARPAVVGGGDQPLPALVAEPAVDGAARVERLREGFAGVPVLDIHGDPDHNRSVFTAAAAQGDAGRRPGRRAAAAVEEIDLNAHDGLHPCVGALDVMPVVHLDDERRGAACAEVLTAAARVGDELEVPVFLYGELATRPEHRERADLRRGGWRGLAERMERGELVPDFGPPRAHPTAGAVLATARPPLVAFNVDLDSDDVELARAIAAAIRESAPGGLPGVRAIGLMLEERGRAQVSTNVHDHRATPLAAMVEAVRARAPVAEAELVGLAPEAAFEGFPEDVPLRGFDPERHLIENALRSISCMAQTKKKRSRKHRGTPAGTIERCGPARQRGQDQGQGRPQAGRARAPDGADEPPAHLARLREPRRHRRRRLRGAGGRCLRPRARSRAPPWRCSCSCSTSRSGT